MSVQNILRFTADLSRGVVMTPLRMAFIRGEDMGHCFLIQAEQEGKKLPLTGASVNGFMIRADGTTLTIAGTVADGLASLALPAAAYSIPGRFRLVIQSTLSGVTTTLFWGEGAVSPSYTDVVAIPEEIIMPSLENIEAQVEEMVSATAAAKAAAQGAVVRNYLDNSDFRNPVNQRGVTETTEAGYNIDRWIKGNASGIFKVGTGYVSLTGNGAYYFFRQYVSPQRITSGKVYTIAFCDINGDVVVYPVTLSEGMSAASKNVYFPTAGISCVININWYNNAYDLYFTGNSTAELKLVWAALYEGTYTADTLPAYQPKERLVELYNCGVSLNPVNLLDNSDFRNPVNQRGATLYSQAGYCIDRWKLTRGTAEITADGLKLTTATLPQPLQLRAGTYTMAFYLHNGTTLFRTFQYDGVSTITDGGGKTSTTNAYITMYNQSSGVVAVQFVQGDSTDAVHTLVWAALYEGAYTAETLPVYQSKGYAAELAECQRYYWKTKMIFRSSANTIVSVLNIQHPQSMRIKPTISYDITEGEEPNGYSLDIDGVSFYSAPDDRFTIKNYSASADL